MVAMAALLLVFSALPKLATRAVTMMTLKMPPDCRRWSVICFGWYGGRRTYNSEGDDPDTPKAIDGKGVDDI